jgi:peptide/nickel transport system substrate-binding protein
VIFRVLRNKAVRIAGSAVALATAAAFCAPAEAKPLKISLTAAMSTKNPYGDSSAQWYSVWCQVYGCLGYYDWKTKEYKGQLAEKWELVDNKTWRFHLRTDLKRHDGGPAPTAQDVVHSWRQIKEDPDSVAKSSVVGVTDVKAIDDHTVDFHTKNPDPLLLTRLFDRFAVTSKELFDKNGKKAYDDAPYGWGPYKLEEFAYDNRIVLRRNDDYPGLDPKTPDVVVYQMMREPEQRVTALLNGEIQIARLIPPQLISRLQGRSDVKILESGSTELMFLAFNVTFKPWDDARVRRAAAMAIDKDLIIKRLFNGYAERLDGPLGPNQLCYEPGYVKPLPYDPAGAKKLLQEAGYKLPLSVDIYSANGRYVMDKQPAEVMAQMLSKAGFDAHLKAPEWANFWANVRSGKAPNFHMGRGGVIEASGPLADFVRTGVTPRVKYSNAKLDKMIDEERAEFDPVKRCKMLHDVSQVVVDEAPMIFLWSFKLLYGMAKNVDYPVNADGEIWLSDVRMN